VSVETRQHDVDWCGLFLLPTGSLGTSATKELEGFQHPNHQHRHLPLSLFPPRDRVLSMTHMHKLAKKQLDSSDVSGQDGTEAKVVN
jgi:hypothetical protein